MSHDDHNLIADESVSQPVPLHNKPGRRLAPSAVSLICGLVAFSSTIDLDQIRSIQRYCTTCWSNAKLDPGVWEDCTQEVCVRLLSKMKEGIFNWSRVLESDTTEDSPERRELIRVVDAVRKQAQRLKKYLPLDDELDAPNTLHVVSDHAESYAIADLLRTARKNVLTPRQDRIIELWSHGAGIAEIAREIGLKVAQVSDEKYKAICKLEGFLGKYRDLFSYPSSAPGLA